MLLIFLVDQLSALPAPYVRLVIRSSHRLDMSPVKLSTIGSFFPVTASQTLKTLLKMSLQQQIFDGSSNNC